MAGNENWGRVLTFNIHLKADSETLKAEMLKPNQRGLGYGGSTADCAFCTIATAAISTIPAMT